MQSTETRPGASILRSRAVRNQEGQPHVVLVVARGEAVRNFLYSDTLRLLSERARVTLLTVIHDEQFAERFGSYASQIVPLREFQEHGLVSRFRFLIHAAHYRWLWSEAAKFHWALHDARARTPRKKVGRWLQKGLARLLAHRPALEIMTAVDRWASLRLRPTTYFDELFRGLAPDLVFNCSHIHGPTADLPIRVAKHMGIPTAAFLFSWDNLVSRSRIFVPYDYYLVWNQGMCRQLLGQYPAIGAERVYVTGTPQFDFHFKPEFLLTRENLCGRLGLDPRRPYVLYTTGMDSDFLDEYKIVEAVIGYLRDMDAAVRPQLVVRTYVKGTSPEMMALASRGTPDVVFPPILWDKTWIMPMYEDLSIYSSLLHHASLGINAASTVSLELMMLDKPVINLGLEPPGSNLPYYSRFSRHIDYEHYRPVAQSGGVMVARSMDDLREMLARGLADPQADSAKRRRFIEGMFDGGLDGNSGRRVAECLGSLALRQSRQGKTSG